MLYKQNKRLLNIILLVVLILLVPFVAMRFSKEVNWSTFDFVVAGVLLFSTGLLVELVIRKVTKKKHRIVLFSILIISLLIIWLELAVGIFGTPLAGS